ncbi:uncharacterized protein LOC110848252 isoform X2 [Folsomia candida]|uniref:uncharacterized protein LOC110848252 isoform X2 n=1 Tax=Folsomia candida TaxID=158441 RepID=UPI000B908EC7|nr:uncharacterized protein LOC110848252 isoform X2 [Folsomia candida]
MESSNSFSPIGTKRSEKTVDELWKEVDSTTLQIKVLTNTLDGLLLQIRKSNQPQQAGNSASEDRFEEQKRKIGHHHRGTRFTTYNIRQDEGEVDPAWRTCQESSTVYYPLVPAQGTTHTNAPRDQTSSANYPPVQLQHLRTQAATTSHGNAYAYAARDHAYQHNDQSYYQSP